MIESASIASIALGKYVARGTTRSRKNFLGEVMNVSSREPHYQIVRDCGYPEFLSFSACKTILNCINGWASRFTPPG